MSPIRARSRRPTTVDVSMLSSSARFRRIKHRRLPGRHHVPGPAQRRGRVNRLDLTSDEPIEQVADCREPCLTLGAASSRVPASIQVDVHWLHGADRRHADQVGRPVLTERAAEAALEH
jgi:hypothetical protein